MVAFLEAAGFVDGREQRVQHSMKFDGPEEYLNALLKATPIGHSLSEEEPAVQEEILQKTRANLQRWSTPTGLILPAECVIVGAHK